MNEREARRFIFSYNLRRRAGRVSMWLMAAGLIAAEFIPASRRHHFAELSCASFAAINFGLCWCPSCGRFIGSLGYFKPVGRKPFCADELESIDSLDLPD
jgi:hypothetical protein